MKSPATSIVAVMRVCARRDAVDGDSYFAARRQHERHREDAPFAADSSAGRAGRADPIPLTVLTMRPETSSPVFARSRQCSAAKRQRGEVTLEMDVITESNRRFVHLEAHRVADDARVG